MNRKIFSFFLAAVLLTACAPATPLPSASWTETTQETSAPIPETTQIATLPAVTAPEALSAALAANGMSLQTLTALGCAQLVTVCADGTSAQICMYALADYAWQHQEALCCAGFVGRKGVTAQKQEGDKCTPTGLFPITQGFYIGDAVDTGLSAFPITKDTYWVDDPNSQYYNRHMEGTEQKDWRSAEHMLSHPASYACGFVIGYNTEAIPHAGSAIFLHVGTKPTAGCIATDRNSVLSLLATLDETKTPYILIY